MNEAPSLKDLLCKPENKTCADCRNFGPMWASLNLGVFLCIRCAGLHRKLGVNVSRVKSVSLDRWSSEQLERLEKLGNRIVNSMYEAYLPKDFQTPKNDYEMESFIQNKYVQKKWHKNDAGDSVLANGIKETDVAKDLIIAQDLISLSDDEPQLSSRKESNYLLDTDFW